MRILYVCSGNKNNGQPGTVVKNQIDSIIGESVCKDVFTINKSGFIGYINAFVPLLKKIRKTKPDIIHSHYSLSAFLSTLALMLLFSNKCKHIVSLMGSDVQANGWKRSLIQFFNKTKWHQTIVKSDVMAKEIQLKRYTVLPNGVDLELVKPNTVKNNLNNPLVVLFAANPNRPEKNITLTRESLSNLEEVVLKVVYDLPHFEIIREINCCDIVLLTSKWEGSPNIVKEAMACNKCIVSTDVGDVKELFGGIEGCFLTTHDSDSVENNVKQAIEFVRHNRQTKGRERIIELGLSSSIIKDKLMNIYLN